TRRKVQALQHTRPIALNQGISLGRETQQRLSSAWMLEIERHRRLVPADVQPPGGSAADRVTHAPGGVARAGPLDLDPTSPEVRKMLADAWSSDDVRELHNRHSGQRQLDIGADWSRRDWKTHIHTLPSTYYLGSRAVNRGLARAKRARSRSRDLSGRV